MDERIADDGREDVLNSIRRLVAQEAGGTAPLLLTQELRVGGWRPAAPPVVDDAELARRRAAVLAYVPGPGPQGGGGAEGGAPAADPPLPASPARTALADEDALRALVAEVVREELRGALGERITRNVRRMVRREIANEMAARQLD